MVFILRLLKPFLLIFCVLLLSNCTKVSPESHVQINKKLASPYTMPAGAYLALAKNQVGDEKQSLLLMAAGRFIYEGQWRQGRDILAQIGPLSAERTIEKNLLLAKVDLMREQPKAALAKLANVREIQHLPIYYQAQYHEMLASAYQSTGNATESVMERIKLEALLPDEAAKANNRRALWLSLTTLPLPELDALAVEVSNDSLLKGWVELALISRKKYDNPQAMLADVEAWQVQYPHHPANYILPQPIDSIRRRMYPAPRQIALLLPLSGPLAGPGMAVKDGFMAAFEASGRSGFVKVREYNTNAADSAALYEQALADGADYVVGPLSKADVALVAPLDHPVPTLLLNDIQTRLRDNAYLFGLSPTSEARQVAAKARKQGHTRALVIAPAGAWGDDIVNAFSTQWRANGGDVVDTLHYGPHDDMTKNIRTLLHVSESLDREKSLQHVLGNHVETTPRRRQDIDMVFLVAYPSTARQVMPLLKYYYAGDLPVYATSSVYTGSANSMKDRDLDGIIFCDMPWVFNHQMGSRNWPEQFNSYNRLYALGLDSYALSNQLNQLLLFPALGVSDNSGVLYLSDKQQIARILVFGQFQQGLAHQLS